MECWSVPWRPRSAASSMARWLSRPLTWWGPWGSGELVTILQSILPFVMKGLRNVLRFLSGVSMGCSARVCSACGRLRVYAWAVGW